jgi:CBS domain-containing protein
MVDEPYLYLEGRVADVMSSSPIVISKEESLERLLDMFKTYHYHGFPVVDEEGELVGIVRDTDIISIFARRDPASVAYRKVEDIMHTPPLVIDSDETIQNAIIKMFADQTRFLVVVDKDGKVAGVVTRIDLIKGVQVRRPQGNSS